VGMRNKELGYLYGTLTPLIQQRNRRFPRAVSAARGLAAIIGVAAPIGAPCSKSIAVKPRKIFVQDVTASPLSHQMRDLRLLQRQAEFAKK